MYFFVRHSGALGAGAKDILNAGIRKFANKI